ncbi:uncharacterized protein B0P05DRAFT_557984 [Gilbertella persicaria]|uniref:uncharacterized protein n=1 Tax=Gilbertella persicaria TaxID=101096 RepID=UPI0022207412|nr:uncharacterized protein B0P05DRAFT_557984 [Gilbertella persicaria]KAI8060399.1 hypothetical protein B0P05DRAFT_557984 [Gilbertella persicaria]
MSQQRDRPVPAAHKIALIPPSVMEFPVQRRWAATIFAALLAWKATQFISLWTSSDPELYSRVLFKSFLLDTLYFSVLYIVKIPWLQFSLLKTLLLIFGMYGIGACTFSLPFLGVSTLLTKGIFGDTIGKLTSVSQGRPVNIKDIIFNSSHILGRHTVHILPYGTAKLNPNDEVYCLPSTDLGRKDIYIPIILNNTMPRQITLSRHEFETGTTSTKHYSGKEIIRATEIGSAQEGIEYYYVRIRKPGAYKLEKIVSKDGVDVRLYNRVAYIFTCPYARFKPMQAHDYCTGDTDTLQLEVMGVPPLHVEYKRKNDHERDTKLKLDRIQPDHFDSPLLHRSRDQSVLDPAFFAFKADDDYAWAAVQHLNVNLSLKFESASIQDYSLLRVMDGAGNEIDLSGLNHVSFDVHGRPQVKFQCSQTDPAVLLMGAKSSQLPISLEGATPFHIEYTWMVEGKQQTYKIKLNHGETSLSVSEPGEYSLVSVSDQYCQGQVLFPSTCQVVQPPFPAVKLQSLPIASECAGDNEVGMKFVAEFTGAPPYVLEYTVSKQNGRSKTVVERKREHVDRSRHIFSYLPSSSGEYTYEFTSLDDRYYKKRPTDIVSIKQIVHPQPDAKFISNTRRPVRTCLGEDLTASVELRGTGPYRLFWTVDDQLYSDVVETERYTIRLPPFERPGQHIASLVKIEDANGCVKELEARDYTIEVRRDRPTAFFSTEGQDVRVVETTEGSGADLPLRLTGEGPWTVSYRHVEEGDRSRVTKRFSDPNAWVHVTKAGHYELVSVEDAICKGDPLPYQYLVKWIDKPTISIPEDQAVMINEHVYERPAVCQGVTDAFAVAFSGQSPFYASYKEYRSPLGSRSFSLIGQEDITPGRDRARIPLKTRESGKYKYVFERLADQRYTNPFKIRPLQIEQVVHAIPTVKFSSKSARKDRTLCVGDTLSSPDMDPLFLEFTGVAPFRVELGLRLQSELNGRIISLDNIMTNKYKLELPNELSEAGTYLIRLLTVNDANGCGTQVSDQEDAVVSIKALEIPLIAPTELCEDVCVGDKIEFGLSGMGPFSVQYLFNGKNEIAKTSTSKLTMIADQPGNITVVSVGDKRNKCRSFPKQLSKQIHPIPSSIISGGKDIIENIHEGDMVQAIVDFVGTPPFDFEWRRSRLIWDNKNNRHYKGEVLESHIVTGVQEHRYSINTSVEGIIEIVSIKDRYCHYPI